MPKVKFKARTTEEIENLDIENGSLIYNTENGKTYLDYDNERISTGGGAGGGVATGDTPPENPEENDLWVDTNDEEHLAEIDDEVSTTSTNAVQNQAITNYVKEKAIDETSYTIEKVPTSVSIGSQSCIVKGGICYFYVNFSVSANIAANTQLLSGFPKPIQDNYPVTTQVVGTSGRQVRILLTGIAYSSGAINSGETVLISGAYKINETQ